jgi:hypothetical protein
MPNKRIVHVVGTGTIGEPLIGLLSSFRNELGTDMGKDEREVIAFCFTPQDGNSLLSSISATEWFLYPDEYEKRLECIENHLFQEI